MSRISRQGEMNAGVRLTCSFMLSGTPAHAMMMPTVNMVLYTHVRQPLIHVALAGLPDDSRSCSVDGINHDIRVAGSFPVNLFCQVIPRPVYKPRKGRRSFLSYTFNKAVPTLSYEAT